MDPARKTRGQSDTTTWQATDLKLERRNVGGVGARTHVDTPSAW